MNVLVIAPHNDDEILGVGGTIAKHISQGDSVYICSVTVGNNKERAEMIKNEALAAHDFLGITQTIFLNLPVVNLSQIATTDINGAINKVVQDTKPEIAYIPHRGDMHIDHKVVSESSMVALRPINNPQLKFIYAYETLSETEWDIPSVNNAFVPNVWVDVSETIDQKLEAMSFYKSQLYEFPHPRSIKAIKSLSQFRGSTVGVNHGESFMLIRAKY